MAAALQSALGCGVKLPHDLVPDDSKLVFLSNTGDAMEIEPDGPIATAAKDHDLYSDLALAYYNKINDTGYKVVDGGRWCSHTPGDSADHIIHHGFGAAESTVTNFFAVLKRVSKPKHELVVSCCIADGLKTIGCEICDNSMCKSDDESCVDLSKTGFRVEYSTESILSRYGHCLADDVNLSEKSRLRMDIQILALEHFNKKKKTDYKLVDALPECSIEIEFVIHCNFIARQNSPEDDVSKKLFFAELKRDDVFKGVAKWVVTACRIIHGCETRAGCINCFGRKGKKVVHPTSGFWYGRYPRRHLRPRHSPPQFSLSVKKI